MLVAVTFKITIMYFINLRNNYALNLLFSFLLGIIYFKHVDYAFFAFILFSFAYLLILLPYFILQALTKWPLSLAYLVSFLLAYVGCIMLFKGDQDFITYFMKIHHGQQFWNCILPFLVINGSSILLLKIKEDSKKMKVEIEQ